MENKQELLDQVEQRMKALFHDLHMECLKYDRDEELIHLVEEMVEQFELPTTTDGQRIGRIGVAQDVLDEIKKTVKMMEADLAWGNPPDSA